MRLHIVLLVALLHQVFSREVSRDEEMKRIAKRISILGNLAHDLEDDVEMYKEEQDNGEDYSTCGKGAAKPKPFPVAKVGDTNVGAFPSHVEIMYQGIKKCSGAIISKRWILTSAQCASYPKIDLKVRVGAYDIEQSDPLAKYRIYDVQGSYTHYSYNEGQRQNDIALLKVSKDIVFSADVRPACLPPPTFSPAPTESPEGKTRVCYMTGWGPHPKLQQSELPIIQRNKCSKINYWANRVEIGAWMFCGGWGSKDVESLIKGCHSELGSPLYCKEEGADHFELSGVVSIESRLCDSAFGALVQFTNVHYYNNAPYHEPMSNTAPTRSWIKFIMETFANRVQGPDRK